MQIAFNKNKERIHIEDSKSNEEYFCPFCGARIIRKMGSIYAHHFAHKNCECTDKWSHDMSDWHINWQNKFPKDCQEIVVRDAEGNIHRADVLINDTVIEFQHSTISKEEFEERNEFYNNCGYRVVWVFDMVQKFKNYTFQFCKDENTILRTLFWRRPSKIFNDTILDDEHLIVFLQGLNEKEDICLWKLHDFDEDDHELIDVLSREFNTNDFVNCIYNEFNSVKEEYIKLEKEKEKEANFSPKTILELWDEHNKINYMIVKNVKTGIYVKFSKNPAEQFKKYGKVYGYIKKDEYSRYNKHSTDIFAANWKIWVLA